MTDHETEAVAARVTNRWPYISGAIALGSVLLLGALIFFRENNLPFEIDTEWMGEIVEHRNPFWQFPAMVMNNVGGGLIGALIVPLVIIGVLCIIRRFWSALYFAIATVLSAGLVQLLKGIYDRPRPSEILVSADIGSFPSGHVANAATMAVVLGFIVRRLWVWMAGIAYTIIMLLSRTYLGAHWLSDTVGGLILGAAVAVVVWAPFAQKLLHERRARSRAPRAA